MTEFYSGIDTQPTEQNPEQTPDSGNLSYRDRIRSGFEPMADGNLSLANLSTGIVFAREDLRLARTTMGEIDSTYAGALARQEEHSFSDELRTGLTDDLQLVAEQAGFADPSDMPDEQRAEMAHDVATRYEANMTAELAAVHPEWSADEIEAAVRERIGDYALILGMNAAQRDEFAAAHEQYHDLQDAMGDIESELGELRAERRARLSRIGRAAVGGVVRLAGKIRNAPNAISARLVIAGMNVSDRVRNMTAEKRRTAFWGTAAGVAIAGIAGYVAFRSGHGPSGAAGHYTLAGSDSPLMPDHLGNGLPDHLGSGAPTHAGASADFIMPDHLGSSGPDHLGVGSPVDHVGGGASAPDHLGANGGSVDHLGSSSNPDHLGAGSTVTADHLGASGGDTLTGAHNTSEFFGSSSHVEAFPDQIRVSQWDSQTLDGSLTGISRQMLIRSGVQHPSANQMSALIDSLRPQAQPNGFLLEGQSLDLRPAKKALEDILA